MSNVMKQNVKETLTHDFPEYENLIYTIWDSMESFKELTHDYFICKQKIIHLNNLGKKNIAQQYHQALDELKVEIHAFLGKIK